MLFAIKELIEEIGPPETVNKNTRISEALNIMVSHDFSQLPIIDENNYLCGIITDQSILKTYFHTKGNIPLLELTVDHCQDNPVTISPEEDILDVLDLLESAYAVVVVQDEKPVGILTSYDTTHFLRSLTEGLIFVQDIEISMRQYIEMVFEEGHQMQAGLVRAFGQDRLNPDKLAKEYENMSFWDHVVFITTEGNWEKFDGVFEPKGIFVSLMEPVRDIRNMVAHFRGQPDEIDISALKRGLNWINTRPKLKTDEIPHIHRIQDSEIESKRKGDAWGKYAALYWWLSDRRDEGISTLETPWDDINRLLDRKLPESAYKHRSWWGNHYSQYGQSRAWLDAGFMVDGVDFESERVKFRQSKKALYPSFFYGILQRLKETRPGITQASRPSLDNWFSFGAGISGYTFGWVLPREEVLRVELYIDTGDVEKNKEAFDKLHENKDIIEEAIGSDLIWDRMEGAQASRISVTKPFRLTEQIDSREEVYGWGVEKMLEFVDVFQPSLRKLSK